MLTSENEIFLSDIDIMSRLSENMLNLVDSPVGSGKTTFITDKLIPSVDDKREILILIDTTAGRDQILNDDMWSGNNSITHYTHAWYNLMNGIERTGGWGDWTMNNLPDDKVPIMTYSKMAYLIKNKPDFGVGRLKYIVLDECQNLKIFQSYNNNNKNSENVLKLLEDWLKDVYDYTDIKLIALSATPKKIKSMFPIYKQKKILTQEELDRLRTLKNFEEKGYSSIYNLLSNLPNGRGVIYTSHINQMIKYYEFMRQNGEKRNIELIWSRNNTKYPMNNRQYEIWDSILNNRKIPDETDILIYNAGCQTGVSIKTPVDFMIADEWDADTITQARGRIRNDLPLLLKPSKTPDYFYLPSDLLGERIYQQDKKKVVEYINFRNDGHLKGWNTVKPMIQNTDTYAFDINERTGDDFFRDYSNGGDRRYHIIRLND